jgi:AcrR family transcriptional regulator
LSRATEALLNAALIQAIEDWGGELERALAAHPAAGATPLERFEAVWSRVIESFASHRQLWAATFEAYAQLERAPSGRDLADALRTIVATVGPGA